MPTELARPMAERSRSPDLYHPEMLRDGRMAGLVKLWRRIGIVAGQRLWAIFNNAFRFSGFNFYTEIMKEPINCTRDLFLWFCSVDCH
jgi:hypothetical protein